MRAVLTTLSAALVATVLASPALALETGAAPPAIEGKTAAGEAFALEKLKGKVVVVDFWASWCGPCKEEMPVLESFHKEFGGKGLVIVGVNVDKKADKMTAFLKRNPVSFAVLHDKGFAVASKYEPTKMPSSFFIDKKGVLRFVHRGFKKADVATMRAHIETLLAE